MSSASKPEFSDVRTSNGLTPQFEFVAALARIQEGKQTDADIAMYKTRVAKLNGPASGDKVADETPSADANAEKEKEDCVCGIAKETLDAYADKENVETADDCAYDDEEDDDDYAKADDQDDGSESRGYDEDAYNIKILVSIHVANRRFYHTAAVRTTDDETVITDKGELAERFMRMIDKLMVQLTTTPFMNLTAEFKKHGLVWSRALAVPFITARTFSLKTNDYDPAESVIGPYKHSALTQFCVHFTIVVPGVDPKAEQEKREKEFEHEMHKLLTVLGWEKMPNDDGVTASYVTPSSDQKGAAAVGKDASVRADTFADKRISAERRAIDRVTEAAKAAGKKVETLEEVAADTVHFCDRIKHIDWPGDTIDQIPFPRKTEFGVGLFDANYPDYTWHTSVTVEFANKHQFDMHRTPAFLDQVYAWLSKKNPTKYRIRMIHVHRLVSNNPADFVFQEPAKPASSSFDVFDKHANAPSGVDDSRKALQAEVNSAISAAITALGNKYDNSAAADAAAPDGPPSVDGAAYYALLARMREGKETTADRDMLKKRLNESRFAGDIARNIENIKAAYTAHDCNVHSNVSAAPSELLSFPRKTEYDLVLATETAPTDVRDLCRSNSRCVRVTVEFANKYDCCVYDIPGLWDQIHVWLSKREDMKGYSIRVMSLKCLASKNPADFVFQDHNKPTPSVANVFDCKAVGL